MLFAFRKKILIAGPYTGEFGWELMGWQGWVRKLRRKYDSTIVISYANSEYLYEECQFYPHSIELRNSSYGYGCLPEEARLIAVNNCARELGISSYDWFSHHMLKWPVKILLGGQEFIKYYEPPANGIKFDIVFHFRDFHRDDGDQKNLDRRSADEIISWARNYFSIACIGDPDLSYCPCGAIDKRSRFLKETIRTICSARLVVGGSSGPMHLSSLCGIPILVWIGPPADIERYLSYWNPLRSKVFVLTDQTFKPPTSIIIEKIETLFNHDLTRWECSQKGTIYNK